MVSRIRATLRRLRRLLPHRHDYEMTFPNPEAPMDWVFRCRCGATTSDQGEALSKMRRLTWRRVNSGE